MLFLIFFFSLLLQAYQQLQLDCRFLRVVLAYFLADASLREVADSMLDEVCARAHKGSFACKKEIKLCNSRMNAYLHGFFLLYFEGLLGPFCCIFFE